MNFLKIGLWIDIGQCVMISITVSVVAALEEVSELVIKVGSLKRGGNDMEQDKMRFKI